LFVTSLSEAVGLSGGWREQWKQCVCSMFGVATGWDASPTHHPFTPIRKQRRQQRGRECCRVQSEAGKESKKKSERRVCVCLCVCVCVCVCVCTVCSWAKLWVLTLEAVFGCWTPAPHCLVFQKGCTVAELLHIAYDSDNDLPHIGIILLCEVLAPSLLNMHECLKWILEDFFSPPTPSPPSLLHPSSSLSNYIIIFLSIKIRMNNLNVWQQPGSEREGLCSAAGRQGCFWWAMHGKLTLLWWKKGEAKQ